MENFKNWKESLPKNIEFFCEKRLEEAYVEAIQKNLLQNLTDKFIRLGEIGEEGSVHIMKDFAPFSFYFVVRKTGYLLEGGVIYHGPHDRGGDGGGPTYSVTLTPTFGWMIHT